MHGLSEYVNVANTQKNEIFSTVHNTHTLTVLRTFWKIILYDERTNVLKKTQGFNK
jgi:hypothetical protein